MSEELIRAMVTVATAIVGIAILAVIVSKQANTSGVISSLGRALSEDIAAAVSPVTGGTFNFGGGATLPSLQ